jgi:mannose-6-phosphate isomerase-like protein (cupin superfamily)
MSPVRTSAGTIPRPSSVSHGSALTFETLLAVGDDVARTRLRPGEDTLLRVIAGVIQLGIGTEQRLLCTGEEAIIAAGAPHRIASVGGAACFVTGFRSTRR